MEFDNIQDYISQTYGYDLETDFLNKNIHGIVYLKVVRCLSKTGIQPAGQTAEMLFQMAFQAERAAGTDANRLRRADLIYQLADIHAEIEMLISKSGASASRGFSKDVWVDGINS
jgi:hypothetical protein